jgi:hypothetical protein
VGRWGRQVRGPRLLIRDCFRRVLRGCVLLFEKESGFSQLFRDPHGCPRHYCKDVRRQRR